MNPNIEIPTWRRAVRLFLEADFAPNSVVPHEWLFDAFAIDQPTAVTPKEQADAAQFAFMAAFKSFSEFLLVENRIALAQVRGVGYRVVPAIEQVSWAEAEGQRQLDKALYKRDLRIRYTDTGKLDAMGRQQRSDAMARAARLRVMMAADSRRMYNL